MQTQAWQELDAPEGFFDSVPRREYYDFKVPEGDMLHCRTCVEVSFFAAGDSYPFLVIKGSGRIRVPNGVSIRVYPGSYGVAMWTRDKHDDEVMVDRDHREW